MPGGVQNGGARLADQQLAAGIRDLHLQGERLGGGVEDAGVMDVMELQRHGIGTARKLKLHGGQTPCARRVGRRHVRSELDGIRARDLEERRPLVVRRAQRRHDIDDPSGDRGAQDERVPRRGAAAAPQGFIALGEPRFRRAQTRFSDGRGPLRFFHPPRGDGSVGQQAFGARHFRARRLERGLTLCDVRGERRAIVAGGQPRLQASERLARGHAIAHVGQRVGAKSSRRRRRDDRLAARQRIDRGRHADRRPHLGLLHRRGGELVRPLLFLQIGDRRGIVRRVAWRLRRVPPFRRRTR